MTTFITVIHFLTCALLVLVVLIQSGKGAEISASFSGSSQTVFGSSGGANFFTRFTSSLAAIFFVTSLLLTVFASQSSRSVFESAVPAANPAGGAQAPAPTAPAAPAEKAAAPAAPAAPAEKK